ncbi:hypothetical protein Y032_0010g1099 [Ancylostoma ceylanicum]|uniref:PiggyBac transposable element-derived protein domain-containing protein n=2 Tax=Ancylostoma ceylanicum TaxID=53326 RepID=A0A016VFZ3_9BILA|nr:hypothetical protein Y032_0010g1099 [Ancylostoma ceylanicum]
MSEEESNLLNANFERLLVMSEDDEPDDSDDDGVIHDVTNTSEVDQEEKESDDDDDNDSSPDTWSDNVVHDSRTFNSNSGKAPNILSDCNHPIDFFFLFVNDDVLNLIVDETNRYGLTRNRAWVPTDVLEMKRFFGLCLQMGIVKLPNLRDYWSTRPVFAGYPTGSKAMSRNRFEDILSNPHLVDNASFDGSGELYKVTPFIRLFDAACKRSFTPGQKFCIDESLVPFSGRVIFRQYIPNKRHKYGIKLFKLCTRGCHTWRTIVYAGRDSSRIGSVAESVVMKLMDGLLDEGRHLYTNNWYTSLLLAERIIPRRTHLIGTVNGNRKGLPMRVTERKLKKEESVAQQNKSGITVLKWRDKRDILMLSTTHDAAIDENRKPQIVEDYNQAKLYVDTSDQMVSYSPFVRRTKKCHIRLLFHLLTQTSLVNAWRLYNDNIQRIRFNDFKIEVIEYLLNNERLNATTTIRRSVEELAGPKAVTRRRCSSCYRNWSKKEGSRSADVNTKKVNTQCNKCHKHFCIDRFNKYHRKCSN